MHICFFTNYTKNTGFKYTHKKRLLKTLIWKMKEDAFGGKTFKTKNTKKEGKKKWRRKKTKEEESKRVWKYISQSKAFKCQRDQIMRVYIEITRNDKNTKP